MSTESKEPSPLSQEATVAINQILLAFFTEYENQVEKVRQTVNVLVVTGLGGAARLNPDSEDLLKHFATISQSIIEFAVRELKPFMTDTFMLRALGNKDTFDILNNELRAHNHEASSFVLGSIAMAIVKIVVDDRTDDSD